jgi:hypothetical protein
MSANDKSIEQQQQQQDEQASDLPTQQPSADEAEGVKGGMVILGSTSGGAVSGAKYVPTMQTKDGGSTPLT